MPTMVRKVPGPSLSVNRGNAGARQFGGVRPDGVRVGIRSAHVPDTRGRSSQQAPERGEGPGGKPVDLPRVTFLARIVRCVPV